MNRDLAQYGELFTQIKTRIRQAQAVAQWISGGHGQSERVPQPVAQLSAHNSSRELQQLVARITLAYHSLILCQEKDRVLAKYSLRDIQKPIGVSEYELTSILPETLKSSLPTVEEIEAELSRELEG
jgi:hypothetical protein